MEEPKNYMTKTLASILDFINNMYLLFEIFYFMATIVFYVLNNEQLNIFYNQNISLDLKDIFYFKILICFGYLTKYHNNLILYFVYLLASVGINFGFSSEYSFNKQKKFAIYLITFNNLVLSSYTLYQYLYNIKYFKISLDSINFGELYEELNIRLDMIKINLNSLLVNLGLHKYFKWLLFRLDDYHFSRLNSSKARDDQSVLLKNKESICNFYSYII